jgi:formate hydrogenlyase subunit 4
VSDAAADAILYLAALLLAPLLPEIVNKTKAVCAGRRGPPLVQGYRDMAKLVRKGTVYSRTAGWVFRAGPAAGLAAGVCGLAILPWAGGRALLSFSGDFVLFAGLFALGRFLTMAAALDTGSAFEGMGASREAWFGALAEPALLLALAGLARTTGSLSLSGIAGAALAAGPALALAASAVYVVFLAENARIPVDDPNTHLELTMIHEVMVLDHGGPDLAMIQYGSAVKLWAFGGLLAAILLPRTGSLAGDAGLALAAMLVVSVATGVVESVMARLRMVRVPQLLTAASAAAALSLILAIARGTP